MMIQLMLPYLQKYWKPIAYIAIIAIIFLFGWYKGYSYEKQAYDTYKSQIEAESKAIEIRNAEIAKKQKEITDNLARGYADAVTKLNDYYRSHPTIWMYSRYDSKAVSEVSDTARKSDGEAKGNQSSATEVTPLDCASDVLQLLYLQKWIREQTLIE